MTEDLAQLAETAEIRCDGHWGPGSLRAWAECPLCNPEVHEFTEDVGDASMCVCGVPALTHDAVYSPGEQSDG